MTQMLHHIIVSDPAGSESVMEDLLQHMFSQKLCLKFGYVKYFFIFFHTIKRNFIPRKKNPDSDPKLIISTNRKSDNPPGTLLYLIAFGVSFILSGFRVQIFGHNIPFIRFISLISFLNPTKVLLSIPQVQIDIRAKVCATTTSKTFNCFQLKLHCTYTIYIHWINFFIARYLATNAYTGYFVLSD